MKITVITLFPNMIKGFFEESIIKRASENKLVELEIINLRDFSIDSYGTVDDRPYGGGAGMVLRADVMEKAIEDSRHKIQDSRNSKTVITSPKGKAFNQGKAGQLSQLDHLIIIAGHYEAVDERVMDFVDEEISMGDFVLTGGEIVAAAIVDSIVRLIPGVLKKEDATQTESFFEVSTELLMNSIGENEVLKNLQTHQINSVQLLEYPHFTRPEELKGKKVPEILLSGNHAEIEKWRLQKAYEETVKKRPDLLHIS